jgi:hypothetical protein
VIWPVERSRPAAEKQKTVFPAFGPTAASENTP